MDTRMQMRMPKRRPRAWSMVVAGAVALGGACVPPQILEPVEPTEAPFPTLPADARVALMDVALAWPLPPGTGPTSGAGFLGPILRCEDLLVFEPLTRTDTAETLCASLTVTAARLDPCFKEGGPGAVCQPQVRLVLQPVVDGQARDASIHAFYDVPEREVVRAIARLTALRLERAIEGRRPLGVHPLLEDEGVRGVVGDIVLDAVAAGHLAHFTQITVHGDDAAWTFEFRPFVDGAPGEGDARQQHVLSRSPTTITVSVTPAGDSDDDFSVLLDEELAAAAPVAEQQAAYDRAARVENPGIHDPGTIDCARCHLAAAARAAATARSPLVDSPDAFVSATHDLTPGTVFSNPQFIHAFAWRHTDLAVNARVVNEAAVSADLASTILSDLGVLP